MSYSAIFRRLFLPVIAVSLLASTAHARFVLPSEVIKTGPLKDTVAKLEKDPKDKDAVAALKKAADGGDKDAQFAYAFALQSGLGGLEAPKDKPLALLDEAKALYKKAGDAGQEAAVNNLGLLKLATGEDVKSAIALIEDAANSGNAMARITMAQMYIEGAGVPKDPELAVRWLERAQEKEPNESAYYLGLIAEAAKDQARAISLLTKAANNKYLPAMVYLGNKFLNGTGVQANAEEARKWFTAAVEAGLPSAKVNLGVIAEYEAAQEKDKDKQKELFKKALALYQEAADLKVGEAYNKMGYYYENGLGVTKDDAKAYEWYKKGSDAGVAVSTFNLGVLNEEGRGVKAKSEPEALQYYYTAAKAGLPAGQTALAQRYRGGKGGLDKDPIAAMAWLEKAAQAGNVNSQIELANMLETGEAGYVNLKTSSELYIDAAKKGSPVAMYQISDMLEKGRGLQQDLVQAYGFLTTCAKLTTNDEKFGKQAADKLQALKEKMTPDQIKAGDEFFKKLTGVENTNAPAKAPAAATPPSTKPAAEKPKDKKK